MFCPNCGAENQDGAWMCVQCHANLASANQPKASMSKKEFFATTASVKAKNLRKIAMLVGIVCLVFAVASAFITTNSSIFKIPVFGMVDDSFEELEEQYEEAMDEFDSLTDDEIDELEDELDMDIDDIEDLYENPSLSNMKKIAKTAMDDAEVAGILSIFSGIIIGYAIFIALFELLAVLLKQGAFGIVAIIVSILYFVLFAGMLMFVIFIVLNIAQIVLYSMANKEYKAYKNGSLN